MRSADQTAQPQPRKGKSRLLMVLVVLLGLPCLLVAAWWLMKAKAAHERAAWKGPALRHLAELSITNKQIQTDKENIRMSGLEHPWAGEHVLLMTNGEYIIFASRHGANNGFVDHLFLGHGSNGKWLYSTYHFCNSMAAVRVDDEPGSISEFCAKYAAREFDGKSDECLKHTWPPAN